MASDDHTRDALAIGPQMLAHELVEQLESQLEVALPEQPGQQWELVWLE